MTPAGLPVLRGVGGALADREWPIPPEGHVIGRDPAECSVVVPASADEVSRRHCTVRWDPSDGLFALTDDGSMNGTHLGDGRRLDAGVPHRLPPGAWFSVGTPGHRLVVELRPGRSP